MVGGRIDVMLAPSPASSLAHGARRLSFGATLSPPAPALASAPEIPTVDEQGFPGFHMSVWGGLFAPKGTPKDVIVKLNAAAVDAPGRSIRPPAPRRPRAGNFSRATDKRPRRSARWQKAEIEKWWPIIKAANIEAE